MVVHYAVIEGDDLRPLCDDWAGSPSWTRAAAAVTCPRCREMLERSAERVRAAG